MFITLIWLSDISQQVSINIDVCMINFVINKKQNKKKI
jgi:hypothetical protein